MTQPQVKELPLAQRMTDLVIGKTLIVEVAICKKCGARYGIRQVDKRCFAILHECPKCHNMVSARNMLNDTCPNCGQGEDESKIILKQPGHRCNGLIVPKKEVVRVEQTE